MLTGRVAHIALLFVFLGCSAPQQKEESTRVLSEPILETAQEAPLEVDHLAPPLLQAATHGGLVRLPPLGDAPVELRSDGTIAPLAPAYQALFDAAPQDPRPEKRASGSHFYAGNEKNVHIFFEDFKERGGAYAGVGTEQAYIFIGWQKPQVAFLVDYDYHVLTVHRIHQLFLLEADSPEQYIAFWRRKSMAKSRALIEERFAQDPDLELLLTVYEKAQDDVSPRLKRLKRKFEKRGVPCFLTDLDSFRYVQAYLRSGRARLMLVNLLESTGVVGLGETARALGVPIRVFYTSNAEQYWTYSEQFQTNIRALHVDDRSVIVRTLGHADKSFDYVVQPITNFVAWLDAGTQNVYKVVEGSDDVQREKGIRLKHTRKLP